MNKHKAAFTITVNIETEAVNDFQWGKIVGVAETALHNAAINALDSLEIHDIEVATDFYDMTVKPTLTRSSDPREG